MLKLNRRIGVLFLIAVLVATAFSFSPGLTPPTTVQAATCYTGWYYTSWQMTGGTFYTCPWDFGCWINPNEPNGEIQQCQRWVRYKIDIYGVCGTEYKNTCLETGVCC
jgi:hypothetical protein